jgi:hypothetical protein
LWSSLGNFCDVCFGFVDGIPLILVWVCSILKEEVTVIGNLDGQVVGEVELNSGFFFGCCEAHMYECLSIYVSALGRLEMDFGRNK